MFFFNFTVIGIFDSVFIVIFPDKKEAKFKFKSNCVNNIVAFPPQHSTYFCFQYIFTISVDHRKEILMKFFFVVVWFLYKA